MGSWQGARCPAAIEVAKVNASTRAGAPRGRSLPHTVQVGEVKGGEQLTEGSVADPAEESQSPPEAREEAQLKHTHIVTPARERKRKSGLVSTGFARYLPWVFKASHLLQFRGIGLILKTAS